MASSATTALGVFDDEGRGNLFHKDRRRVDATLFGDNILALQPFKSPGVLLGGGLLLLKDDIDLDGLAHDV